MQPATMQPATATEATDYNTRLRVPELPRALDFPYTARAHIAGPDGFSYTACLSFMHRDEGVELLVWGNNDTHAYYERPEGADAAIEQAEQQLAEAVGRLLDARGYAPQVERQAGSRDLMVWKMRRG